MEKWIKKEVVNQIKNPSGKFGDIISEYMSEVADTEKIIFIKSFFMERKGYWTVMRELRRKDFYIEKSTFYRIKDDIIIDIALRACYEQLLCPYGDDSSLN